MPNETPTSGATPSNPPIPRNPQPIEQVPFYRDDPRPARGMLARVRAWFAAAVATVKAAAAPQAQQGTDLVDTAPPAPGKFRLWLSAAWAAVKRGRAVVVLLVIGALSLIAVQFLWPDGPPANPPAAVQTNSLAPLIARIESLDARVVELQDQVTELEDRQPMAAPQRRTTTRSTPPPAGPPTHEPTDAWSAPTDLDRAIDTFNATLQESAK